MGPSVKDVLAARARTFEKPFIITTQFGAYVCVPVYEPTGSPDAVPRWAALKTLNNGDWGLSLPMTWTKAASYVEWWARITG